LKYCVGSYLVALEVGAPNRKKKSMNVRVPGRHDGAEQPRPRHPGSRLQGPALEGHG